MKKNIGNADMIIRLILAVILILLYFIFNLKDLAGLLSIIVAALLVITAFTRVCPLYTLFKTDTLKKEDKTQ